MFLRVIGQAALSGIFLLVSSLAASGSISPFSPALCPPRTPLLHPCVARYVICFSGFSRGQDPPPAVKAFPLILPELTLPTGLSWTLASSANPLCALLMFGSFSSAGVSQFYAADRLTLNEPLCVICRCVRFPPPTWNITLSTLLPPYQRRSKLCPPFIV